MLINIKRLNTGTDEVTHLVSLVYLAKFTRTTFRMTLLKTTIKN